MTPATPPQLPDNNDLDLGGDKIRNPAIMFFLVIIPIILGLLLAMLFNEPSPPPVAPASPAPAQAAAPPAQQAPPQPQYIPGPDEQIGKKFRYPARRQ
ncbi:MAG: hypothetical protein IT558_04390 [Alphaproteobacteria bacterium]|nr:hypothetical protein [Alphaproteobacteria bacterium]